MLISSHTYSGHALGACLASKTLAIIQSEHLCSRAQVLQTIMKQAMQGIADRTGLIHQIRGIGAIVAANIRTPFMPERAGYHVYQEAVRLGAWLRPLNNTLYWLPPLNCPLDVIDRLSKITEQALLNVCKRA